MKKNFCFLLTSLALLGIVACTQKLTQEDCAKNSEAFDAQKGTCVKCTEKEMFDATQKKCVKKLTQEDCKNGQILDAAKNTCNTPTPADGSNKAS